MSRRPSSRDDSEAELEAAVDSVVEGLGEERAERLLDALPPPGSGTIGEGTRLGEFELVREIGVGGMGVVFEARQQSVPGKRVAVKILPSLRATPAQTERFRREIAAIGRLDHASIVPVLAAGVEAGTPYFAMKYVDGIAASKLIRRLASRKELPQRTEEVRRALGVDVFEDADPGSDTARTSAWSTSYPNWAAHAALEVAEALQHAHEHDIVHRDVKPGNVMITREGHAVLMDFGLATHKGDESLTMTGDFLGTLSYAPPEQALGRPVDTRGDVYSLGATLYEMIALRRAFDAENKSQLLRLVTNEGPPSLHRSIPFDLRTICTCALSKDPARRYATPGAMAHDLRQFLSGRPIEAKPPGIAARAFQWLRRHPKTAVLSTFALAAVVGLRLNDEVRARIRLAEGRHAMETTLAAQDRLNADVRAWRALEDGGHMGADIDFVERSRLETEIALGREHVETGYRDAETTLRGAFDYVAGHRGARRELARTYAERLRQSLYDVRDVLARGEVDVISRELERLDPEDRYGVLRSSLGRVEITCDAPGSMILVHRGEELVAEGPSPLAAELPEGTYFATISAEDHASALLPFLVRREACYDAVDALPPRELAVDLLPPEDIDEDFVHVSGGWTLVHDAPPRFEYVDSFLMERHEVTYGMLLDWLPRLEALLPHEYVPMRDEGVIAAKPRYKNESGQVHIEFSTERNAWQLTMGEPEYPLRGLALTEMSTYAANSALLGVDIPEGWYVTLPTRAEWIRAARGAGGSRFPFGDDFDWNKCASYGSGGFSGEAEPYPILSFEADISPFGIRDLAGSVREACLDVVGPIPGHFAACGGSYRSDRPEQMEATATTRILNEPMYDVGFRRAIRELPAWLRQPDAPAESFHDDFERPDGLDLGAGWVPVFGSARPTRYGPYPVRVELSGGRLVCEAPPGNFSDEASAWRRIHVGDSGLVATATLRARAETPSGQRSFGIVASTGFGPRDTGVGLNQKFQGSAVLSYAGSSWAADASLDPTQPLRFELRVLPGLIEGRIWPLGADRPQRPLISIGLEDPAPRFRYLGFKAQTLVGARVEVDDVVVDPLD